MDEPLVVIDGRVVPSGHATVSVLDRGLLYGDGLFEVLRTWSGRAASLEAHLDRLEDSARLLRLPVDRAAITRAVQLALAADPSWGERRIRIVVTRGPGGLAVPMASAGPGHTIVIVERLGALPETTSLAVVDWPLPRRAGRGHKTLAYLDHLIARELARDVGAEEAARRDADGKIAEGGACNLFCVERGVVRAIRSGGVLPGITAARVEDVCRRSDIPLTAGPIDEEALLAADEVFTTSAVRGVVAVTRIVSDGERALPRGPLTERIRAAYLGAMSAL